jgi:hypothetical protein
MWYTLRRALAKLIVKVKQFKALGEEEICQYTTPGVPVEIHQTIRVL